jgi:alanine dehydrogenase
VIIGVPQEVKNNEFRVGLTPGNVSGLCKQGHSVLVQRGAGEQIGLSDESYRLAGATLINSAAEVFQKAEMIVKVKEPQAQECAMLREDQILFTYLHLAPDPKQTKALLRSGATCIAYETVTAMNGALPLLAPMSEVAGRMSIQAAATHLEKTHGGLGVLMAGVPGVSAAKIVILGVGWLVVTLCKLPLVWVLMYVFLTAILSAYVKSICSMAIGYARFTLIVY